MQINDFFYSYEKIDIEDDVIGRAKKALRRDGNTQSCNTVGLNVGLLFHHAQNRKHIVSAYV